MQVINYFYYKNKNLEINNSKDNNKSHNNMKTFFSSTDINTLKEEGRDRNNFVSLIVNNEGTYTAAITRKIISKKEYISYELFGEGERHDIVESNNNSINLEYFYFDIIKETNTIEFTDIEDRLKEIRKNKTEKRIINNPVNNDNHTQSRLFNDYVYECSKPLNIKPVKRNYDITGSIKYDKVTVNKDTLNALLYQIITGSVLIPCNSKLDINKWVSNMEAYYIKRFGKDKEGLEAFYFWAETYTEYLTWGIKDSALEETFDCTEICAIYSYFLILELEKLEPNPYINGYIDALEKYLVL